MKVENAVELTLPEISKFLETINPGEPFVMVNLLKFKPNAEYQDGRVTSLSGAEAYQIYLDEVIKLVQTLKVDVQVINDTQVFDILLGTVEELWDRVVLVRYPSKAVFSQIITSIPFQEAQKHRIAGLAGQLNIGTKASM